jgi:hypothetical protein
MNWDQFKKNIGTRYQFEPPACRLDEQGNELPEINDDWIFLSISPGNVSKFQNERTHHIAELGKDAIFDFRSNPARGKGGIRYGFLVLKMQVFLQGVNLTLRPNTRPGEPANRARRIRPAWTPWVKVASQGMPPETTQRARIQYRLWCDDPAIPLVIRIASTQEGGYSQELSGPSGVADQLILESQTYYVSVSHPQVRFETAVASFSMKR